MKIKVSKATNNQLNWLVASTLGKIWTGDWYVVPMDCRFKVSRLEGGCVVCWLNGTSYRPTTSWEHGGPIIEREGIGTWPAEREDKQGLWGARMLNTYICYGPTPLIAACRCIATKHFGAEAEVPGDLT